MRATAPTIQPGSRESHVPPLISHPPWTLTRGRKAARASDASTSARRCCSAAIFSSGRFPSASVSSPAASTVSMVSSVDPASSENSASSGSPINSFSCARAIVSSASATICCSLVRARCRSSWRTSASLTRPASRRFAASSRSAFARATAAPADRTRAAATSTRAYADATPANSSSSTITRSAEATSIPMPAAATFARVALSKTGCSTATAVLKLSIASGWFNASMAKLEAVNCFCDSSELNTKTGWLARCHDSTRSTFGK